MQFGILLLVLGVGSFVLPMIGFQFSLMSLIEDYQPWAGIGVAAVGALITIAFMLNRKPQAADGQPAV
ncbi:hypothetical protein [Crossiella sp. CA198]|uniref:hypothetical protein n=1 Tax=Crossiella sp. CA198 TaxID=3455607 RepID=UPI003F8D43E6